MSFIRLRSLIGLLLMLCLRSGGAHPVQAQSTTPPPVDRTDLARRFYGLREVPPPRTEPLNWQSGDRRSFQVVNSATQQTRSVDAALLFSSTHAHIWADVTATMSASQAEQIATRFDNRIYTPVRALWGSEPRPGRDGDSRVHLLFTGAINPAVAGYFASRNSYATAVIPGSNAHDMLIFHTNTLLMPAADLESLLAHEFQHMIRYHIDPDEAAWMNEGFSLLTEQRLGYRGPLRQAEAFLAAPQTSLTVWDGSQRDYGAAFLWLLYFQERYGADALRDLSDQPLTGLQAAEALLGRDNLLYFLADQVLASRLQKPGTPYGYRTASLSPAESTTLELPATRQAELVPYGTHYYHLSNPPPQITLSLSQPDSLPLIDVSAEATDTPDSFWYSQRGDMQNPRLTHALDLRDITAAQVQFRVWYALESHWDYAYLSISRDGGRTWQIQDTALTTSQNPGGNAYGSGYTGRSGGWRTDTLSLNNVAGEQIQLRLEVVTDATVHEAGFALSDAVWLRDDGTSQPLTNWYAEGFVHTADQTALQTWLQVARTDSTGSVHVSRWLVAGDGRYTLPPLPDVVTADISITPLADLSTVPVSYTLRLTR